MGIAASQTKENPRVLGSGNNILRRIHTNMIKLSLVALLVIIFICPVCFAYSDSEDKDEWIAGDKALHVGVSFVLDTAFYNFYKKNTDLTDKEAKIAAFLSALSIGFAKEFIDDKFSWKDIGADTIGAGIGAAVSYKF
jgi:uncharacterized protein YfiM (DUF2279 family)